MIISYDNDDKLDCYIHNQHQQGQNIFLVLSECNGIHS